MSAKGLAPAGSVWRVGTFREDTPRRRPRIEKAVGWIQFSDDDDAWYTLRIVGPKPKPGDTCVIWSEVAGDWPCRVLEPHEEALWRLGGVAVAGWSA